MSEKKDKREEEKFHKMLMKRRMILLGGSVSDEVVNRIRAIMLELNSRSNKQITLLIDSGGGSVDPGLWLYDFFGLMRAPVTGLVNGKCYSMAAVILQGCKRRFATPNSEFLIHQTKVGINDLSVGKSAESTIRNWFENAQISGRRTSEILAQRMGSSVEAVDALKLRGTEERRFLSAQEALGLHLIDEIVESFELFKDRKIGI